MWARSTQSGARATTGMIADSSDYIVTIERATEAWTMVAYDRVGAVIWVNSIDDILLDEERRRLPKDWCWAAGEGPIPASFDWEGVHYLDEAVGEIVLIVAHSDGSTLGLPQRFTEHRVRLSDGAAVR